MNLKPCPYFYQNGDGPVGYRNVSDVDGTPSFILWCKTDYRSYNYPNESLFILIQYDVYKKIGYVIDEEFMGNKSGLSVRCVR